MKKIGRAKSEKDELEIRPDAWARFEKAVDVALHAGPPRKVNPKKRKVAKVRPRKKSS
jgi:hypothetical protein